MNPTLIPKIISGDCREILKTLPDNSIDHVVTDPPYEINYTQRKELSWDREQVSYNVELWAEILRVMKPGGNLAVFGHNRTYHRVACAIEDAGFRLRESILAYLYATDRVPGTNLSKKDPIRFPGKRTYLKPSHDPILLAVKPYDGSMTQSFDAWGVGGLNVARVCTPTDDDLSRVPGKPSTRSTVNIAGRTERSQPFPGGRYPMNTVFAHHPDCQPGLCDPDCQVSALQQFTKRPTRDPSKYFPTFWYGSRVPANQRPRVNGDSHPTIKPLSLMEWLVKLCAEPGQTVLDPFAGSGTTLEAAQNTGIRSIGIEMNTSYVELMKTRLRVAERQ